MQWTRKAADMGLAASCVYLARCMYTDHPYAREFGLVGEAAGVSTSAGVLEGHDVPPDVLASVVHWLLKGGGNPVEKLAGYRQMALVGSDYCCNETCEVVGRGLHSSPFQLNLSASFHRVTQN